MWIQSDSDLTSSINFQGVCVTRLMCSPLASNFWGTPVLVHKGLIHGVMTSLPWQTSLQSQQSCTIALACSVGYKWRSYWDSLSEGLISYMWIQSDSDLKSSINFHEVCVTGLMCSPLAGNLWGTPVLVHKGLIHGVMTSLPWQTGLQCWQSCTIALAHSVGYKHWLLKKTLVNRRSICAINLHNIIVHLDSDYLLSVLKGETIPVNWLSVENSI